MITTIVTFVTEKIVAVVIATVVVVAAVPTLIVAIHGNTITITTVASAARGHDDEERAKLVLQVRTAGDSVVVNINSSEASCDSQIDQLAGVSTLSASATRTALENGKAKFKLATAPLLKEIKDDEDEFERLNVITTTTTQTFLVRISRVQVTAFGENGTTGILITTCQTILVEIRQTVVVIVKPSNGESDDMKVKV